jgi:hypothetical protein
MAVPIILVFCKILEAGDNTVIKIQLKLQFTFIMINQKELFILQDYTKLVILG